MDKSTTGFGFTDVSDIAWIVPADIILVFGFVLAVDAVLLTALADATVLRAALALPTILFVPGYVLVAALFPAGHTAERSTRSVSEREEGLWRARVQRRVDGSITWTERTALSFGLSVGIIPLLGFLVGPITGSLGTEHVLLGLNAFIAVFAVLAVIRRNGLQRDDRLRLPFRDLARQIRRPAHGEVGRIDRLLAVVVLCSFVAATATMGWVLIAPQSGESFSSVALLAEDGSGELATSGYPTNFTRGSRQEVVARVTNQEGRETTYTVVGELQHVVANDSALSVTNSTEVYRSRETVGPGENWTANHSVTPSTTGEDLRLIYYLYRSDPPEDPSTETAYRSAYIWVDVTAPADRAG